MGKTLSITLAAAYEAGRDNGYGIGECNVVDYSAGQFGKYLEDCTETEVCHFRQFSPFEFLANDLNGHPDPDRAWERYEHGIYVGLKQAWKAYHGR